MKKIWGILKRLILRYKIKKTTSYPIHLLRGIKENYIQTDQDACKNCHVIFKFEEKTLSEKNPGYIEESINWKDDDEAIEFTLNLKKEGRTKYRGGIVVLIKDEIDSISKRPYRILGIEEPIKYDRDNPPDPNNKYHGNLLLNCRVPEKIKRTFIGKIFLDAFHEYIPQKNTD